MLDKIEELERRSMEIESLLSDPAVMSNQGEFRKLSKEHADLAPLVEVYRRHRRLLAEIEDNQGLLAESDPEIREMAKAELEELEQKQADLEAQNHHLPKTHRVHRAHRDVAAAHRAHLCARPGQVGILPPG